MSEGPAHLLDSASLRSKDILSQAAGGFKSRPEKFLVSRMPILIPSHFKLQSFVIRAVVQEFLNRTPGSLSIFVKRQPMKIFHRIVVIQMQQCKSGPTVFQQPIRVPRNQSVPRIKRESNIVRIEVLKRRLKSDSVIFGKIMILQRDDDAKRTGGFLHFLQSAQKS